MKFVLFLCVLAIIALHKVNGKPGKLAVQDLELASARGKRQIAEVVEGGLNAGIGLIKEAVDNAGKCAEKAGCWKGYCWTYCGLSLSSGDWCYTTKSYSQSFQYVTCSNDSECDACWKCSGSCTL